VSEHDQQRALAKRLQWEEHNRAKALAKEQEKRAHDQAKTHAFVAQRQFQAVKGTRDLLPPETALWYRIEQTAHEIFRTFGFDEIRMPILEPTELFARSIGEETDVVSKEMYSFSLGNAVERHLPLSPPDRVIDELDREEQEGFVSASEKSKPEESTGDSVTLRPEATASVCRAYIEHSMQQLPQPVKLYYSGPMFRRERPQKGRYRQFYQIGAEVLGGSDAPPIDAELIEMLMTFFENLDLEGTTLHINSIGHNGPNCRPAYVERLRAELTKLKDRLGPDSQRRIDTNPLRVLDSKLESEQAIIATLPRISDHLCADCAAHYAAVKSQLELRGVIYRENWRLVRGLDYYMRTTFEITAQGLGSQNAVCGGGRYDGLVELLGGPPTKGIGFAIGEDRLILSLQESGKPQTKQVRDVYIAWMGEKTYATAVRAAKDLRNAGFSVELPSTELKFGKALGQADKLGAKFALILGENEVSEGLWTLKRLADGTQQKLPEPALIEYLRQSSPS
jgi:histidyl-tRNA synthetase